MKKIVFLAYALILAYSPMSVLAQTNAPAVPAIVITWPSTDAGVPSGQTQIITWKASDGSAFPSYVYIQSPQEDLNGSTEKSFSIPEAGATNGFMWSAWYVPKNGILPDGRKMPSGRYTIWVYRSDHKVCHVEPIRVCVQSEDDAPSDQSPVEIARADSK